MKYLQRWVLLILFTILLSSFGYAQDLDYFAFEQATDHGKTFIFSNNRTAHWFGQFDGRQNSPESGLVVDGIHLLQNYHLLLPEGSNQHTWPKTSTTLYPDRLYSDYGEVSEELYLLDSMDGLLINLNATTRQDLQLHFRFDALLTNNSWQPLPLDGPTALYTTLPHPAGDSLHVGLSVWGKYSDLSSITETDKRRRKGQDAHLSSPRGFAFAAVENAFILLLADTSLNGMFADLKQVYESPSGHIGVRTERLQQSQRSSLTSSSDRLTRAYGWAGFAASDLSGRTAGKLLTKLPDRSSNTREILIAFKGAYLVPGRLAEARELLRAIASKQDIDINSLSYGRLPGLLNAPGWKASSPDLAAWFALAAQAYLNYSGDRTIVEEMFPIIKRANEGIIKYHLDEYGFLVHGDASTWMDESGLAGPYSPRGNRAIEIQALWIEQLAISKKWARDLGHDEWAVDWELMHNRVHNHFNTHFWDVAKKRYHDHLLPGTPSMRRFVRMP